MSWPEIFPDDQANREPWCFECSVPGCTWKTWHRTQRGAWKERDRHDVTSCPYTEGIGMPLGPTLHEKLWEELDKACAVVMGGKPDGYAKDGVESTCDPNDARAYDEARGNARGLSIAVYHMGTPFYPDVTTVTRLAVKRYQASIAGEEMPPTLGIDGYNPHIQDARDKVKETEPSLKEKADTVMKKTRAKKTSGPVELSDEQKATVAAAIKGGIPIKSIASLYKMDEDQVQAIADAV